MENEELDLVVFEDDQGNQIQMEVLDYLFYEGKEYAFLAEYEEGSQCNACEEKSCEDCANKREGFVMEVVELDDEMEEFVPVSEELAERLIEIFENSDFDEEEYEIGDAEDDEE